MYKKICICDRMKIFTERKFREMLIFAKTTMQNDSARYRWITSFLRFSWMRTFGGRFAVVWRTLSRARAHPYVYRLTRGRVSSGKGRRSVIRHTETTSSQTIGKRRLILSMFRNEIFRAFPWDCHVLKHFIRFVHLSWNTWMFVFFFSLYNNYRK